MIYFLSLTHFPTKKAYGVTISGTHLAAVASGFKAEVIAPNSLEGSNLRSKSLLICMRALRFLYRGVPALISKLAFAAHRVLFCLVIKTQLAPNPLDVFWIRDLSLAEFLSRHFPNNRVILEVHQLQSRANLIRMGKLSNDVILGPISEAISKQLEVWRGNKVAIQLSMGVSEAFFSTTTLETRTFEYDIGYFGSYKSGGHEQGIDSVLVQLIPRLKTDCNFRVLFAGVGREGVNSLRKIGSSEGLMDRVDIVEHLEHSLVADEMRRCRTLLLPYPEGTFFEGRFPIKALEYAATKRPILCSRTKSHTNLFGDHHVWFYEFGDPTGLLNAFDNVRANQILAAKKVDRAFDLAREHTYFERVNKVKPLISQ